MGSRAFQEFQKQAAASRYLPAAMHFPSHFVFAIRSEQLSSLSAEVYYIVIIETRCPLRVMILQALFGSFSHLTPIALDCNLPTYGSTLGLE
jgi:hypothetical protein